MMNKMKEVIERFPDVHFQLIFIIQHRQWVQNPVTSQHGADELNRDKWIACAQSINSKVEAFLPLLYCINRHPEIAIWSDYYKECSLGHGYDPREIESCFWLNGVELLYDVWIKFHVGDNIADSGLNNPTLLVDGVSFTNNQTSTVSRLVDAFCYQFMNPDTSGDISWVPAFTGLLFLQFFVLLWIIKRDDVGDEYSTRACNILSMCFESEHDDQQSFGDLILENWARQSPGGEEEEDEDNTDIAIDPSFSDSSSEVSTQEEYNPEEDLNS